MTLLSAADSGLLQAARINWIRPFDCQSIN